MPALLMTISIPESLEANLNDGPSILNRVITGNGLATLRQNFSNHLISDLSLDVPMAVVSGAWVVYHYLCAARGSSRACSRPMPRPAPVTMATCPSYRISLLLILVLTLLLLPQDDCRFAEMAGSGNGTDRTPWTRQLQSLVLHMLADYAGPQRRL